MKNNSKKLTSSSSSSSSSISSNFNVINNNSIIDIKTIPTDGDMSVSFPIGYFQVGPKSRLDIDLIHASNNDLRNFNLQKTMKIKEGSVNLRHGNYYIEKVVLTGGNMSISNYITVLPIVNKSRSCPTACIVIRRYGNSSINRYDCFLRFFKYSGVCFRRG